MVAAYGHSAGVAHHAPAVNDHFGCTAADIEQATAEVALVLCKAGFGGGERLKHGVADENSCAICGRDEILRSCNRRRNQMNVGLKALAHHSDGIANAFLRVDEKFMRQYVQHFAVGWQSNVAREIDGAAH